MSEATVPAETKAEGKQEKLGILNSLLLLFIAVFFVPIMWLAQKINGGGVGFGPAFASFAAATVIVGVAVLGLSAGLIGFISYLVVHAH